MGDVSQSSGEAKHAENCRAHDSVPFHAEGKGEADQHAATEGECSLEKRKGLRLRQYPESEAAHGGDQQAGDKDQDPHEGNLIGSRIVCKRVFTSGRFRSQDRCVPWIWCDNEWSESGTITVGLGDRGWTHGLGLFETMLAVDGKVWFLDRHLQRMRKSFVAFGWDLDLEKAVGMIPLLLEKNDLLNGRARVRLAVSGGSGPLHRVADPVGSRLWISASPADSPPVSMAVGISRWRRNERSPLMGHKCASYAENLFLLEEARENGWDEVLVLNHGEHLSEAATANVFLIRDDELITPPLSAGCLPGVTREVIMEIAGVSGIFCAERNLEVGDLSGSDGLFLTSSTRGLVPVGSLEGRALPLSPLVGKLQESWAEAGRLG